MKVQGLEQIALSLVDRAANQRIRFLQVLGINSLKTPVSPDEFAGQTLTNAQVQDNMLVLTTSGGQIKIDLQRTGVLVWKPEATPWTVGAGPMPTVRIALEDVVADFTEPSKTKRIAAWLTVS